MKKNNFSYDIIFSKNITKDSYTNGILANTFIIFMSTVMEGLPPRPHGEPEHSDDHSPSPPPGLNPMVVTMNIIHLQSDKKCIMFPFLI